MVIACRDDPAATALRVVSLNGVVVRTLDTGLAQVDDLTFSPDGTKVAYWGGAAGATSGNIYTQLVDGSAAPRAGDRRRHGHRCRVVLHRPPGRLARRERWAGDRRHG